MASKAQAYAATKIDRPEMFLDGEEESESSDASVTDWGGLLVRRAVFDAKEALALADWIFHVFSDVEGTHENQG